MSDKPNSQGYRLKKLGGNKFALINPSGGTSGIFHPTSQAAVNSFMNAFNTGTISTHLGENSTLEFGGELPEHCNLINSTIVLGDNVTANNNNFTDSDFEFLDQTESADPFIENSDFTRVDDSSFTGAIVDSKIKDSHLRDMVAIKRTRLYKSGVSHGAILTNCNVYGTSLDGSDIEDTNLNLIEDSKLTRTLILDSTLDSKQPVEVSDRHIEDTKEEITPENAETIGRPFNPDDEVARIQFERELRRRKELAKKEKAEPDYDFF